MNLVIKIGAIVIYGIGIALWSIGEAHTGIYISIAAIFMLTSIRE